MHSVYLLKDFQIFQLVAQSEISFLLKDVSKTRVLKHLLIVLEHNLPSQNAKIIIGIYALNSILIKNIQKDITITDSGVNYVDWSEASDALQLERGFYVYKITFNGVDAQGKSLSVLSPIGKFVKINEN